MLTYAQVTGVVNDASGPDDYVLTASGGMPGELHGGWRTGKVTPGATSGATMDLEYGFSCMGYEIVAPWGAAMARARTHPDGVVTSIFGDGSYLMLNSELYSAAFAGVPYVAVLCDNAGFAVIHRLQTGQGADGFNNLFADSRGPGAASGLTVDFAAHAASLGCHVETVADGDLESAPGRLRRRARRRGRGAAAGGGGLPGRAVGVDRVRRLVGDGHPRVAVRPRGVRRGEGAPGPLARAADELVAWGAARPPPTRRFCIDERKPGARLHARAATRAALLVTDPPSTQRVTRPHCR